MPLSKPYPHIYRHGPDRVTRPYYEARVSNEGINCFAAYEILKKDLRLVFEYIEPKVQNQDTFSHRTFELLIRACIEVESLCKLVFTMNRVSLPRGANMIRYSDLNGVMKLSEYEILCYGINYPAFLPFESFSDPNREERSPDWYRDYNAVKHNRTENFGQASLNNVIHAVGGVYALLVAQFGLGFDHTLRPLYGGGMLDVPSIFRVRRLPEWSEDETYDYNWDVLKSQLDPYDYHLLPEIP